MTRWKDHERQLAKSIGGKRIGNQGIATADVENERLCIEAKSWQGGVKRVESALQQAEGAAGSGQLAIAVIHTVGRRHANDLVVMRWEQFLDRFGDDVMADTNV